MLACRSLAPAETSEAGDCPTAGTCSLLSKELFVAVAALAEGTTSFRCGVGGVWRNANAALEPIDIHGDDGVGAGTVPAATVPLPPIGACCIRKPEASADVAEVVEGHIAVGIEDKLEDEDVDGRGERTLGGPC